MKRLLRALGKVVRLCGVLGYAAVNAVYKLATRTALYVATVYLALYFYLNSNSGRDSIMELLTDAMPGSFSSATLQWGPLPWDVTLLDANIKDPTGTPVIRCERATAGLDLTAFWGWAVRSAVMSGVPFELRFTKAHAVGADVLVDVFEDGWVGIAAPFDDPTKPSEKTGPGSRIEINGAVVERSRVRVRVRDSGVWVDGRGLRVLGRVLIMEGRTHVTGSVVSSSSGRVVIDGAGPDGANLELPWSGFHATNVHWKDGLLVIGAGRLTETARGGHTPVTVTGRLDTRGAGTRVDARATCTISAEDPLVAWYAGDSLRVAGQLDVEANGSFDWPHLDATLAASELEIAGYRAGPLPVHVRMRNGPFRKVLTVDPLSLDLGGGTVHIDRVEVRPSPGPDVLQTLRLHTRLDGVEPVRLWDLGLLGPEIPVPTMAEGRLDGAVRLVASQTLDAASGSTWGIDALVGVDFAWEGSESLPIEPSLGVSGDVSLRLGEDAIQAHTKRLEAHSGPHQLSLEGSVNLGTETLDLGVDATVELEPFLAPFGVERLDGTVGVQRAHVTGIFESPLAVGHLTVSDGKVYGARIDRVGSRFRIHDGTLELPTLTASTEWGKLRASATLDLWKNTVRTLSKTMPLVVTGLTASEIPLARLKVADLGGTANLRSQRLKAELRMEDLGLEGTAEVGVDGLRVVGEAFNRFRSRVSVNHRHFVLEHLDAKAASGAELSAAGTLSRDGRTLDARLGAKRLELSKIAAVKSAALPLQGAVDLAATAKGPLKGLVFDGKVTLSDFRYGDMRFGDAQMSFHKSREERTARLTSKRFFDRTTLKRGSVLLDERSIPSGLELEASVRNVDVVKILPFLRRPVPVLVVARGDLFLGLDFTGQRPMKLAVELPDNAIRFGLNRKMTPIRNVGPLAATLVGEQASITRLVAEWEGQRLAVCGDVSLDGMAALDVAGRLDLGQLVPLRQTLADLSGRVVTHKPGSETSNRPFDGSCLEKVGGAADLIQLGNPTGLIAVRGHLSNPRLDGALRVRDVRMTPRGFGQEIVVRDGLVQLASARDGTGNPTVAVEIPEDTPLTGTVEDGNFRLWGKTSLPRIRARRSVSDFLPSDGWLELSGEDISYSVPSEYRITVDPKVRLSFSDLFQETAKPRLRLAGRVAIPEGAYFKSFDGFARAFGNVLGRSVDAYSQSLTELLPELSDMGLDLEVDGTSFQVQTEFGLGSIDLETGFDVRVSGSFQSPVLNGQVRVADGTLVYKVVRREFEVTRGWLTFDGDPTKPMLDIEAQTFVELESTPGGRSVFGRQSTDQEEYTITIRVKGRVPEYHIEFDSKPAMSQLDIQYVILTGARKSQFDDRTRTGGTVTLLGANLTQVVQSLLEAPFVDRVALGTTTGGGTEIEAKLRLGRNLQFGVTGTQESGETRYGAVFRFKFNDRLSLEGRLRNNQQQRTKGTRQRYEAELKYTIPLD